MIGFIILCTAYCFCSLLLLCYGMQCYILTYLYLRVRGKKVVEQQRKMHFYDTVSDEKEYPFVVTQLPMFNEKTVALRIIRSAAAMEYPRSRHEIQVLDDSTDETRQIVDDEVAELQKSGINIRVVRRPNRNGFKAGALQYGLEQTKAEFVAIFDADFVPEKDFLKRAIPFFHNQPHIGLVQGRWTHLNKSTSLITRSQAMGIDGHFMIEQAARSWNNLFMNFNGTAGVFRATAIQDAGGWHHDTLTEDMDLSYRMQLAGWKTEYVPGLQVPAEIPENMNAFKSQQFRWAKGSIQTAIKIIPLLFKSSTKISFFKKMQAIMHLTHYSVHPLMLIMSLLSIPMMMLVKFHVPPILFIVMLVSIILAAGGPSFMYLVSQHFIGNKKRVALLLIPAMMLTGCGLAVSNGKAVLEAFIGKKSPFLRTPKKGDKKTSAAYIPIKDFTAIFEIIMGVYCMIGFSKFLGFHNMLVTPFLAIYACGFLFTGILSIIHYNKPEWADLKISFSHGH